MSNNKQANKRRKSTKADTGCQLLDLYQSPKTELDIRGHSMDLYQSPQQRNKKWIPDANLSGLIPISNNKANTWMSDANLSGLTLTSNI